VAKPRHRYRGILAKPLTLDDWQPGRDPVHERIVALQRELGVTEPWDMVMALAIRHVPGFRWVGEAEGSNRGGVSPVNRRLVIVMDVYLEDGLGVIAACRRISKNGVIPELRGKPADALKRRYHYYRRRVRKA
jgi:hypothetical protein